MSVLGIETATNIGSVAIIERGFLHGQVSVNQRSAQSRNLVQAISFLLQSLSLTSEQLAGIAVSIGPGSYTGLRIGLSVAKSLAYIWKKPLLAVNSLDALAQQGRHRSELICSMIRFRRNEYYCSLYNWDGSQIKRQNDYLIRTLARLIEEQEQPLFILGLLHPDDDQFVQSIHSNGMLTYQSNLLPEAYWVAVLGEQNLEYGITEDVYKLTPFYMHDFPIRG